MGIKKPLKYGRVASLHISAFRRPPDTTLPARGAPRGIFSPPEPPKTAPGAPPEPPKSAPGASPEATWSPRGRREPSRASWRPPGRAFRHLFGPISTSFGATLEEFWSYLLTIGAGVWCWPWCLCCCWRSSLFFFSRWFRSLLFGFCAAACASLQGVHMGPSSVHLKGGRAVSPRSGFRLRSRL